MKTKTFVRMSSMAVALSMMMIQSAPAQQSDDSSASKENQQTRTVRGVVAGVTVVGETMVDYETNRAAVAQVTYLSILGKPTGNASRDQNKNQASDSQNEKNKSDAKADKDKNQDQQGSRADNAQARRNQSSNARPNLYVLAIPANCEVCEDSNGKKTSCDMAKLELGDRVEVEFTTMGRQKKSAETKHGKSRTFAGQAKSITILASPSNRDAQARDDDSAGEKKESDDKDDDSKNENKKSGDKDDGSKESDKS